MLATLLRYVAAALAQIAAVAIENGVETSRFLLQAVDAAYAASPDIRGLVLLLGVVASIQTLRSRS